MQSTAIKWTQKTWNPVRGCTKVSPGCARCYAYIIAENKRGTRAFPNGFDITLRTHKLKEARRLKAGELVFVNSMSDLFHSGIPDSYRKSILSEIAGSPATFQTLTKRPTRAVEFFSSYPCPDNLWLGVTVEDRKRAAERIPILKQIPARVRFLSVEPILEPIRLTPKCLTGIHWVIVGGESGPHLYNKENADNRGLTQYRRDGSKMWVLQTVKIPWVRNLRDDCSVSGVPFFFKQWGGVRGDVAGNLLDGVTHENYPAGYQDQGTLFPSSQG